MEKTTIFIYSTKDNLNNSQNSQYRIVRFIGGDRDILDIIKELIKCKYQD